MFLAVDIGNTNIVLAIHDGEEWKHIFRVHTDQQKTADEYFVILDSLFSHAGIVNRNIDRAALSSVVPNLTLSIEKNVYRLFDVKPLVVTNAVNSGLKKESIPTELGSDLLCNIAAAHAQYPDRPVMVCDFGTALTMTSVDRDGSVLGVAIAPGLLTAMNALFAGTAQLPQVELKTPSSVLGRSSKESIRAGIMYGYAGMVDHVVSLTEKEMGETFTVVATGGLSRTISGLIDRIDCINPTQTLDGLLLIDKLNQ